MNPIGRAVVLDVSREALQKSWGWLVALGVLQIVLGTIGLGSAFLFTIASVLLFGVLIFTGGVVDSTNLGFDDLLTSLGMDGATLATTMVTRTDAALAACDAIPGTLESAVVDESLGSAVERQLRNYFVAHGDRLPSAGLYDRVLREVERPLITLTLAATRGNQIKAAHLLGLNRNTLRKKIRELDIQVTRGLR